MAGSRLASGRAQWLASLSPPSCNPHRDPWRRGWTNTSRPSPGPISFHDFSRHMRRKRRPHHHRRLVPVLVHCGCLGPHTGTLAGPTERWLSGDVPGTRPPLRRSQWFPRAVRTTKGAPCHSNAWVHTMSVRAERRGAPSCQMPGERAGYWSRHPPLPRQSDDSSKCAIGSIANDLVWRI